jgi:hypothetical protein
VYARPPDSRRLYNRIDCNHLRLHLALGVGSDPVKVIAEVRHRKDVWGRSGK